ncbi:MAG TPA: phosphonate ABC transporter, permease protein PhnE [Devosiaceae bacterium]|nr:phosphonate ABC transporter, permease protein PhnE [Devosiaceae bacterium]
MTLEADAGQLQRLEAFERSFATERRKLWVQTAIYAALIVAGLIYSVSFSQFSIDGLVSGLPDAWRYISSTFPTIHAATFSTDMGNWYWNWPRWLELLAETVLMSFVGTVAGSVVALLLCFSASRNLVRSNAVYFLSRRVLELARTVPDTVYAMIFVFAFGIGPLPGVFAIAVHTAGALGKLFSEVNESADVRPIEGVTAAGGSWPTIMRLAVLPQVLPNFLSYALLRLESNIRSASVLGIVGAGGIGEELYLSIRQFDYQDISAIVLLIIVVVMVTDLSCEAIRHRVISKEALRFTS